MWGWGKVASDGGGTGSGRRVGGGIGGKIEDRVGWEERRRV